MKWQQDVYLRELANGLLFWHIQLWSSEFWHNEISVAFVDCFTASWRFGQKISELLPESLALNGDIVFELFLRDLDENITSEGWEKRPKQKNKTESI